MTDQDIEHLIEPTLRERLAGSRLERIQVVSGKDHDGDPAVFVELFFKGREHAVDTRAISDAMEQARALIWASGEMRFPYMKLHIPDLDRPLAA